MLLRQLLIYAWILFHIYSKIKLFLLHTYGIPILHPIHLEWEMIQSKLVPNSTFFILCLLCLTVLMVLSAREKLILKIYVLYLASCCNARFCRAIFIPISCYSSILSINGNGIENRNGKICVSKMNGFNMNCSDRCILISIIVTCLFL